MILPTSDRQRILQLLPLELELMQPVATITWGKKVGKAVSQLQLGIQQINFPHLSGAAHGAGKILVGKSPTHASKLAF